MKKLLLGSLILLLSVGVSLAQEKVDTTLVSRIKKEGFDNSQVMNILSKLTDVHGPRLTNSPGYRNAANYAKSTLESWGLQNAHFDYWDEDFGRGWQLNKFSLHVISPSYFPVIAFPKAWTPGIKGSVQAEAVYLDIRSESDLEKYKGKLKGKIVLFSLPTPVKPGFDPDAKRLDDKELLDMANSGATEAFRGRRFSSPNEPERLAFMKWDLCMKEGAIAVLEGSTSSRQEDGTVTVAAATVPYPADVTRTDRLTARHANAPKILPQIVVSAEHYNRIVRQVQQGISVKMEVTLETEFTPTEKGFNVIAEIPGTDLKDEIVLIGAHLDSWHSGTGTTDNAAGSAVMMEAIRILKSLGVSPRRTIRIALWGGEEQGLLGSRNYVNRMYGVRSDGVVKLKPTAEKFSVYFNMDNGTGKYRGVYLQGNEQARPVFREWLKPFEKMGASTLTLQNTSGTDHLSFDGIGLPGFQFIQDPIEYRTRTHHTSMDVFDKAIADDLKHNAVITAAFALQAANRDTLFPRK